MRIPHLRNVHHLLLSHRDGHLDFLLHVPVVLALSLANGKRRVRSKVGGCFRSQILTSVGLRHRDVHHLLDDLWHWNIHLGRLIHSNKLPSHIDFVASALKNAGFAKTPRQMLCASCKLLHGSMLHPLLRHDLRHLNMQHVHHGSRRSCTRLPPARI